jgi:hypothetical protein
MAICIDKGTPVNTRIENSLFIYVHPFFTLNAFFFVFPYYNEV